MRNRSFLAVAVILGALSVNLAWGQANLPNNPNAATVQGPDPTGMLGYPLATVAATGALPWPVSILSFLSSVVADQGQPNAGGLLGWPVRMVGDRLVAIQSPFNLNVDRISQAGINSAIGLYTISNIFGLNEAATADLPVNVIPFSSTPLATDNALATQSQLFAPRDATATLARVTGDTMTGAAGSSPAAHFGIYTNSVGMALDTNLGTLQSLTCRQLNSTPAATDECLATNSKMLALRGFTGTISPAQIDVFSQAESAGTTANAGIYAISVPTEIGNSGTLSLIRTPQTFKTAATAAAGNTALWTPAAGKKFRLQRYMVTVTDQATQAGAGTLTFTLFDGAAGVTGQVHDVFVPALGLVNTGSLYSSGWIDLGNGYLSTAANNVLNINLSAALTAGTVRVICAGTEE